MRRKTHSGHPYKSQLGQRACCSTNLLPIIGTADEDHTHVEDATAVLVRQLGPEDWKMFREMRLHALRKRPGSFTARAETAERFPDETWREFLSNPKQAAFGLFDDDNLIGISAIFTDRDDASGSTALLGMSWINPEWRGKGFSRSIYEARITWARGRGMTRIRVSHRHGNAPSQRAMISHGFKLAGRTSLEWPDGQVADEIHYVLCLKAETSADDI